VTHTALLVARVPTQERGNDKKIVPKVFGPCLLLQREKAGMRGKIELLLVPKLPLGNPAPEAPLQQSESS